MAWRYFDESLEAAGVGDTVMLGGEEARHAVQVARARVGERLSIGNGRGVVVEGVVALASAGALELTVERCETVPRAHPELWLVQALAKGDRDELAAQAATELGAAGVVPWAAERSVVRWDGARVEKGLARWRSITREAAKQSLRAWLPEVLAPVTTAELARMPGARLVLDPGAELPISATPLPESGRVHVLVGPEGGISPRELELLEHGGATRVRLGTEVLRTSTAGPAALAALALRLGRW